jgi:uncharacterized protein (TIGR03086 family)
MTLALKGGDMTTVLFNTALDQADDVVRAVQHTQLAAPTPYRNWNARQLLNYMVHKLAWVPELLSGKNIQELDDHLHKDLLGEDLQHAWRAYAETARKAAEQAPHEQVVRLPQGNVPASSFLEEVAGELIIHTWDLARAVGHPFHINDAIAHALYAIDQGKVARWRQEGLVGPEVPVPEGATIEAKLLGLLGRKP